MKQRGGNEAPPPEAGADGADDADDEAEFSVGQYLRTQRVMRGISVEELSLRTRIPLRSIARLELGAFDGEPDGFVRGFVRTVAEGLGLDPDDTLVRMLREPEPARRGSGLGLPRRAWLALAGVVFLLAAIVGVTQLALRATPELEAAPGDEVVTRQDPVRALAEAQAASPAWLRAKPPELRAAAPEPLLDVPALPASGPGLPAVSARSASPRNSVAR